MLYRWAQGETDAFRGITGSVGAPVHVTTYTDRYANHSDLYYTIVPLIPAFMNYAPLLRLL